AGQTFAPRLGATTVLNLQGGTFTLNSSAGGTTNENLGAVNVQSGFSTFNLNAQSGSNLALTASTLSQTSPGAAVNFVGTGATLGPGSNQLLFTTAPTLTGGIIPYATVNGNDFAVYNQGGQTGLSAPGAPFIAGPNLVTNPGFETGTLSG